MVRQLVAERMECTFTPLLNAGKEKRSFEDFLKDQEATMKKYREKARLRLQEVLINEEKTLRSTPRIDQRSAVLSERKRSHSREKEDVHQKLYDLSKSNAKDPARRSPVSGVPHPRFKTPKRRNPDSVSVSAFKSHEGSGQRSGEGEKKKRGDKYAKKKIGKELEKAWIESNGNLEDIHDIHALCKSSPI